MEIKYHFNVQFISKIFENFFENSMGFDKTIGEVLICHSLEHFYSSSYSVY